MNALSNPRTLFLCMNYRRNRLPVAPETEGSQGSTTNRRRERHVAWQHQIPAKHQLRHSFQGDRGSGPREVTHSSFDSDSLCAKWG